MWAKTRSTRAIPERIEAPAIQCSPRMLGVQFVVLRYEGGKWWLMEVKLGMTSKWGG